MRAALTQVRARIVLLPLTAAVAACTPAQNGGGVDNGNGQVQIVSADSRVTMERMPCFGTCPIYTVEIRADGVVTFTGERFVDSVGTATRRIEPQTAAALMHELAAGGFFDFFEKYTYNEKPCGQYHTDAPRVILMVSMDGRAKTVEHDYGCAGAPGALREMQERVDSVAGVKRWVGSR